MTAAERPLTRTHLMVLMVIMPDTKHLTEQAFIPSKDPP